MGRPITTTVTLLAAVSNGIATSQSLGGPGSLVLNGSLVTGGVAVLDAPRRVAITSAGNDTGITWTITGTGRVQATGQAPPPLVETITGAALGLTVFTTQDFATVTSIASSGATASTVTAGTNGTGSGPWVPWDQYAIDFQVSLAGFILSGNPTWSAEYTYDDVYGLWLPPGILFPRAIALTALTGVSTSPKDGAITSPVRASRLTLTVVGSVQLVSTQQGV